MNLTTSISDYSSLCPSEHRGNPHSQAHEDPPPPPAPASPPLAHFSIDRAPRSTCVNVSHWYLTFSFNLHNNLHVHVCTCKKRMQEPPAPPLSGPSVHVKPNGHPKDDKLELTVGPWKPHDKITLDDKWGQRTRVCATKL